MSMDGVKEGGADLKTAGDNNCLRLAWVIAGDEFAGVGQAVRGLATAVRSLGIVPVVVSLRPGPFAEFMHAAGFEVKILNVVSMPVLSGGLFRKFMLHLQVRRMSAEIMPQLAQVLRESNVQGVHVLWPNLMVLAAAAAAEIGIPCFWEMSNAMGNYPFGANRWLVQRAIQRWGVTVLANSRYAATTLGSTPVAPILLYLGADQARFSPGRPDLIARQQLGIPAGATVFAIVARLERDKGQAVVLQAMAGLPRSFSNTHLLLVGGTPGDNQFGDELAALAVRLGMSGRLHMVGNVPDPERYYGAIDVAVNAYLGAESFGLSVVEAMMMGKPALVHALGGPAETVVDGTTGWHVKRPTMEAFHEGMMRVLTDRRRWAEMGAAARARALEHFTLERQAAQYVGVVKERLGAIESGRR